ncbi:TonB-dependent receptor [Novosphingobium sp. CF614]|uniref:TonB-dependent receptor n=1 Tax=Novosphingobium sp. CF614 TaxID=1884364 RepID=UPI0015A6B698|nr:TonB-dependent receptor [Novosphingobium sp. CF614]
MTARRVEERLQDVPISITVVSQEKLTKANISSAEDLTRVVPGLNVQSRFSSEQTSFSIRGFSQDLRTSASVGTYFGEVVAPRGGGATLPGGDGAGPGSLFDLQNVQVLKGPQGTLFGRNTTGGAVLLTPRKPAYDFEGYVEGSYGNYDMRRLQAVVNAPITDWARLRLGADYQKARGYLHNVSGIGPEHFADTDYIALRGSLVLDLSPNLENYTIVSYLHSDNNGNPGQIFRANPLDVRLAAAARPQIARLLASGNPWQIEQKLINPEVKTKSFQAINTTTLTVSDSLTVKNIFSYATFIQDVRQDAYATNFIIPGTQAYISTGFAFAPDGYHTNDQNNLTEELQLQGLGADGKLNYQVGFYYEQSTPGSEVASASPGAFAECLISGFTSLETSRCRRGRSTPQYGSIKFVNMATYAQATYALTEQIKTTAGIRYTYDRSWGKSRGYIYTYSPTTPGTFVAPTLTSCGVGYALPDCTFSAKTSSKKPTWTLNLQYNPSDDAMVYATYSRGYRQGAVTPFSVAGIPTFDPEKVDNYEIGAKLSFHGPISGNLNLAGFYAKLANQQLQVGLQNASTGQNASSIYNAGKSRIYGVEADGTIRFGNAIRVDGSLAYINSKLQSIDLPTSFPGFDVVFAAAVAGDELPFTPKWGGNVSTTFTALDDALGKLELSATYRYNSSYATAASNASALPIRATPVKQVDLNVDWYDVGGAPVDLSLFATNLTNQFTRGIVVPLIGVLGYDPQYVGRPRMYGARVRYRFGK